MSLASLLGAGIGMLTGAGPVGQGIGAAIGALVSGDDPKKALTKGLLFGGIGKFMPGMAGMLVGKGATTEVSELAATNAAAGAGLGGIGKFLMSPGGAMIAAGVAEQLFKKKDRPPTEDELRGERSDYQGQLMIPEALKEPVPKMVSGGLIEGPGSVTSDSIPGVIKQDGQNVGEIRVSDGEVIFSGKDLAALDPDGDYMKAGKRLGDAPNGSRGAMAAKMYKEMMRA
tara:strand:- start:299 stop:982 length:684 start_codon:yes stop_codon:yes gene_type:complete